ncbi:MAG TPA: hypothetical protein VFB33_08745 [Candidatus Binataceae bacterium]|nr:hypothetical protein [Candidatus Binataceae bacterium]
MPFDRIRSLAIVGLLLAMVGLCPTGGFAQETVTSTNIGNYIQNAKTAEDHEAIAAYYEAEATKARKAAESYHNQYDCYVKETTERQLKGERFGETAAKRYCRNLTRLYNQIARESEDLAKLHHKIADAMKSGAPASAGS